MRGYKIRALAFFIPLNPTLSQGERVFLDGHYIMPGYGQG